MDIKHQKDISEFYTEVNGFRAFVRYSVHDGGLDVRKTLVPKELGGKGIAAALVKEAYDYALDQKLSCLATCSYAVVWLERHPEYNGKPSADYVEGACHI